MLAALDYRSVSGVDALDVTRQAQDSYVEELDAKAASSVWITGGCDSWYVDERSGRLTLLWPDFAYAFRRRLSTFLSNKIQTMSKQNHLSKVELV